MRKDLFPSSDHLLAVLEEASVELAGWHDAQVLALQLVQLHLRLHHDGDRCHGRGLEAADIGEESEGVSGGVHWAHHVELALDHEHDQVGDPVLLRGEPTDLLRITVGKGGEVESLHDLGVDGPELLSLSTRRNMREEMKW